MTDIRVLDYIILRYIVSNNPTEEKLDGLLTSMGCQCGGRPDVISRLLREKLIEIGEFDELVATDKGLETVIASSAVVDKMSRSPSHRR